MSCPTVELPNTCTCPVFLFFLGFASTGSCTAKGLKLLRAGRQGEDTICEDRASEGLGPSPTVALRTSVWEEGGAWTSTPNWVYTNTLPTRLTVDNPSAESSEEESCWAQHVSFPEAVGQPLLENWGRGGGSIGTRPCLENRGMLWFLLFTRSLCQVQIPPYPARSRKHFRFKTPAMF